jgi:hypothetical protein
MLPPNGSPYPFLLAALLLTGCASLQESSKYGLAQGRYRLTHGEQRTVVHLQHQEDSIVLYDPATAQIKDVLVQRMPVATDAVRTLTNPSLDVDVLYTLFKFRPATAHMPPQLGTGFNGNLYLGRRTDIYRVHYRADRYLGRAERQITHFGFSGGIFAGIGSTPVNPFTTVPEVALEYDGLVLQTGIAFIVGVNKLSVGLCAGADELLDGNGRAWIYRRRPWFGLMLGLNLN